MNLQLANFDDNEGHIVADAPSFAHEVLEQVEAGSSRVIESDDLSINGCVIRQFAQGFGDVGELLVERLRVAGILAGLCQRT